MSAYGGKYKEPSITVLIVGEVTKNIVNKLIDLLRTSQSSGMRIYIVHNSPSPKLLEPLRDFILKNNVYTLEIFTIQNDRFKEVIKKEHDKIKTILTSNPNSLQCFSDTLVHRIEVV